MDWDKSSQEEEKDKGRIAMSEINKQVVDQKSQQNNKQITMNQEKGGCNPLHSRDSNRSTRSVTWQRPARHQTPDDALRNTADTF